MSKIIEIVILAEFCFLSLPVGLSVGRNTQDIDTAAFFCLMSACFFLVMFRPQLL